MNLLIALIDALLSRNITYVKFDRRTIIETMMFLLKSTHVGSRISSRAQQYLRRFQSGCGWKSFSISTNFENCPPALPGC